MVLVNLLSHMLNRILATRGSTITGMKYTDIQRRGEEPAVYLFPLLSGFLQILLLLLQNEYIIIVPHIERNEEINI